MRQATKAMALVSAATARVVDDLQERLAAKLHPAASDACRTARRRK